MKRLAALAVTLLSLTACGDDSDEVYYPPMTTIPGYDVNGVPATTVAPPRSEEEVGLDPDYYWPTFDSFCDPDAPGLRVYVTALGTNTGGHIFVIHDETCLDSSSVSP